MGQAVRPDAVAKTWGYWSGLTVRAALRLRNSSWPAPGHAGGLAVRGRCLCGPGRRHATGAFGLERNALWCNKIRVFVVMDKFPSGGTRNNERSSRGGDAGVHGIAQGF